MTYLNINQLRKFSLEKIEALQNLKLKATVRLLLSHTPAYKKIFKDYDIDLFDVKTINDWEKLGIPLIKKSYYIKNTKDFIVQPDEEEAFKIYLEYQSSLKKLKIPIFIKVLFRKSKLEKEVKDFFEPKMIIFSGGTESGIPTPVFITSHQKFVLLKNVISITEELIKSLNFLNERSGFGNLIGMNLFPYGPHLAWHSVQEAFDKVANINLCTAAGGVIPTQKLVKMADKFQPNIFAGMSEYFKNRFLPEAILQKIHLPKKILFINGASKMYLPEKNKISVLAKKLGANAKILDFYGSSEMKEDILPECTPQSGFHHISQLSNIIKTVEAKGTKKDLVEEWKFTENSGYGTIWNIDGAGTLLEGYVVGDLMKISKNSCKHCRLNVERITSIDRIKNVEAQLNLIGIAEAKIKGARVNLSALRGKILSLPEISEAQLVAEKTDKGDRLLVNIVTGKKNVLRKVKKIFEMEEITPEIRLVSFNSLLGKKMKFEGIVFE